MTSAVERVLTPLDRARLAVYRALGPLSRPFVRQRGLRVQVFGLGLIALSLLATLLCPVWLLALGPIAWGTPHLLSDVRYLVVRRGYHRRRILWWVAGPPLLATALHGGVYFGLLACVLVLGVARAPGPRKLVGLAALALAAALLRAVGPARELLFAHAHNFIAIGIWWTFCRRCAWRDGAWIAAFVAAAALLCSGMATTFVFDRGLLAGGPAGLGFSELCFELVPGARGTLAIQLVLVFAFAQSVHYGVWLRLVPEEDRPRATPRSFRASYQALRADFGAWPLWIAGGCTLALALWAVFDLLSARRAYLNFALFHGHLELAAMTLWWAEGKADA